MTPASHRFRRLIVVLLCLLPVALLVVQLQVALTVHSDDAARRERRERGIAQYVEGRYEAEGLAESDWIIVNARLLMRWPIKAVQRVTGVRVVTANAIVQIVFLWAGLFLTFLLASQFVDAGWALGAALAAAVWLSWTFLTRSYLANIPYDLPTLFFSALALWAIATRRFFVLVVAMALGTLNKETIVWCIPAYVFNELRLRGTRVRRDGRFWIGFATLCLLFVVMYQMPRSILATQKNVPLVTASTLDGPFGRLVPNLKHLVFLNRPNPLRHFYVAMLLHLPALLQLRRLPGMLKAAYLATPVFVVPILLFGNVWEMRLFNDLVPLGAAASAYALSRLVGDDGESERANASLAP